MPLSSEEANIAPSQTTLLEPGFLFAPWRGDLGTSMSAQLGSVTQADASCRIRVWVCEAPTARTASAVARKCPGPGVKVGRGQVVRSLCTFHCRCCRERRDVRCQESCRFGSLQANCSIVYSSPTSRGASETQPCGSGPSRKAPVWKVTRDCGGPGKGAPAPFKVGEPMAGARSQQIMPQGATLLA